MLRGKMTMKCLHRYVCVYVVSVHSVVSYVLEQVSYCPKDIISILAIFVASTLYLTHWLSFLCTSMYHFYVVYYECRK